MLSKKVVENLKNSSAIRAMFEEGAALKKIYGEENVFDFSIGNPDPKPPYEVNEAIKKLIDKNDIHRYMNNAGYPEVRQAIADKLNKVNHTALTLNHVVMTCGAGGGLNVILKAITNPGDEIIVFEPYFVEYGFYIDNHGGVMVKVPTLKDTFELDLNTLEEKITQNTKAIILNTPNNPTGVIYSEDSLRKMAEVLKKKEEEYGTVIYLISDEPYREIVYDKEILPSILNIFKNAIIAYSFSKSLSLPGERIGYVAANTSCEDINDLMEAMIFANRALGFVNAPSLFQQVIAKAIDATVDVDIYKERRDLLYNHLISLGFSCIKPQGAFYLFPKCPIADINEFKKIALKHKIIIVPGSGFGCSTHFRLAYCVSSDTVKNSLPAFTALAKEIGMI